MKRISKLVSVLLTAVMTCGALFTFNPVTNDKDLVVNTVRADDKFDNSNVTEDNVLAFAKKYAPESYYILKETGDFMVWYKYDKTVTEGIDTATHEQFHDMSFTKGGYDFSAGHFCDKYYAGNDKYYSIPMYSDYFPTSEWAETLPDSLRTFRFDTYVSKSSTASANTSGASGLINEFAAYQWGAQTSLGIYNYAKTKDRSDSSWKDFSVSIGNNVVAYNEFKFYILGYLAYAKEKHPDVYKVYMNNQSFIDAFCTFETAFKKIVDLYPIAEEKGLLSGNDYNFYTKDIKDLQEETNKKKYQDVYNELYKKAKDVVTVPMLKVDFASGKTGPSSTPTPSPSPAPASSDVKIDFGDTYTLVCKDKMKITLPDGSSGSSASYSSEDDSIASVSSDGVISTKKAGTVKIKILYQGKWNEITVVVLYQDVKDIGKFWYEPVNALTAKNVVKGYDKQTKFKPANDCTRAQMLTFMWRLQGSPAPNSSSCKFPDVKKTDYFYKPVIWAVENGITTGYSDGTFEPQNVCTRAQTVTFLWRMAGKPATDGIKNKFSDVKTGDYFYHATLWASNTKILAGYDDGTFRPQGKCLRRQMVTFLYKFDKYVNKKV